MFKKALTIDANHILTLHCYGLLDIEGAQKMFNRVLAINASLVDTLPSHH
jgi:hypothetical protein